MHLEKLVQQLKQMDKAPLRTHLLDNLKIEFGLSLAKLFKLSPLREQIQAQV